MFLHTVDISKYQQKDGTYIIDIGGDPHIGNNNTSEHHFIKFLESPYPKFLMGDLLEGIEPRDRRFYHGKHKNPVMEAFYYLKHLLLVHNIEREDAGPVLGLLKGNHESVVFSKLGNLYHGSYETEDGDKVEGGLCDDLGIAYGGFLAMFILTDGKHESQWMLTHGNVTFNYKAGEEERKMTNKRVRLRDSLKRIAKADLYAAGHGHQLVITKPPMAQRLVYDRRSHKMIMSLVPIGDPGYYCMAGSFMRVYEENVDGNYAEEMLVEPADIGWIRVFLDNNLKITNVEEVVPIAIQK